MQTCKLSSLTLWITLLLSIPCYAAQYDYHPDGGLYLGGGFNPRNPTQTFVDCLDPFQTERPHGEAAQQTSVTVKVVKSESEIYKTVGVSAELSGSFIFASGRAAVQYSNNYAFDPNSLTYVIAAKTNYGPERILNPTLRDDRANLTIDQLKAVCGPEIVTQQRRGVAIFGVFTLTNISEQQMEQFATQISAQANLGFANSDFQASYRNFVQNASSASRMYMHVYAIGGPGITELTNLINVQAQTNLAETIAQAPTTIAAYAQHLTFANSIPNQFRTMSLREPSWSVSSYALVGPFRAYLQVS